jgi:hypothetical protein
MSSIAAAAVLTIGAELATGTDAGSAAGTAAGAGAGTAAVGRAPDLRPRNGATLLEAESNLTPRVLCTNHTPL